jgi:hypothetical protein
MPICGICGTAYLEGESHVCVQKTMAWRVLARGLAGFVGGALIGYYMLVIVFCLLLNVGNLCGVVGAFVGLPLGAVIGAIIGVRMKDLRGRQ